MAVTISVPSIGIPTDDRFGPFVSAMDTSSAATSTAIYTNTYAQPFTYDIGAPWTYGASQYDDYCVYDDDVCEMLWKGSESDGSDGLYVWRRNILNTYNANYTPETEHEILGVDSTISVVADSTKVTAINSAGEKIGNITVGTDFTRRGFHESTSLLSNDFTGTGGDNGGFSAVYDFTNVVLPGFSKTFIVGQSSVSWANQSDSDARFNACFNATIDDDRYDYDDLYYCPGFNLQASYWALDGNLIEDVKTFSNTWINSLVGSENDATYIANAYAVNTSGFAVGFSTQNTYSGDSGGRARAVIFQPEVVDSNNLNYSMTEIVNPTDDDAIRDTVAIDITDTVYNSTTKIMDTAIVTDASQAFIVVGNRTYAQAQNRSYATEFYTYDVKTQETRYPFEANPIKGANSQVSKINSDGLVVGWRDARGETSPTVDGSARFQSAFIYDYKTKKSAYLDDLYCKEVNDATITGDVRYRFANAISISDADGSGNVTVVANGFDYENVENYKNRSGSSPVVLTMTITQADLDSLSTTSQCPVKADEDYERSGAGMGWFILLPTMMLLFRRFKR